MSSHKAALQGAEHKRVPKDVDRHPTIIGHEFAGTLVEVGKKWKKKFKPGAKFSIQPALNYKGSLDAPGYSYRYIGGDATYVIIPNEVMEMDCLLPFTGRGLLPRLALRAGVLHRGGLPRQLSPGPGLLRPPHGHPAQGDHGPAGRRGPHGPGSHRLGPALRQRQLPAPPAGGDGHRRQPPGAGPQVLPAGGGREDRREARVREHPRPAGRPGPI